MLRRIHTEYNGPKATGTIKFKIFNSIFGYYTVYTITKKQTRDYVKPLAVVNFEEVLKPTSPYMAINF